MKTLLVLLFVFLSNLVIGQSLPTAVDNSKWFPPVRSQEAIPNCTQFSLVYYLKSAIWNKQFNRDPKLEINQFNHNFVWNQMIDPVYEKSNAEAGFYFMKEQGCATMADFPANEQSASIQPSTAAKIKALTFKSKRLFKTDFASCGGNYQSINQRLISLKDSLSHGKCFTINILIFDSFFKMSVNHNIYSCYGAVSLDSIKPSHVVTVVGYDDNIKTAKGNGALKVIDSNADLTQGIFYLDYNWLYLTSSDYTCYFLEEDFSSQPKMVADIKLSGGISGKDVSDAKYPFVEALVTSAGKTVDFNDYSFYLSNQNQLQIVNVNGNKLPLRSKLITKPLNNLDGNYELVSDLSTLSSVSNFKSAAVIVFDPISANYVGADGQSFFSYTRAATANIEQAYLYFIDTDKKIVATVKNLSDTTIIANSFYTNIVKPAGNTDPWIYVKSCTSVLKRKLITFSTDGAEVNNPPVFVQLPAAETIVTRGDVVNLQIDASDPEGKTLVYSVANGVGGTIDQTGKFTYTTTQSGTFSFAIKVSDGVSDIITSFNVKVLDPVVEPLVFTKVPDSEVIIHQEELYSFKFAATGPKDRTLSFSLSGELSWPFLKITFNESTGEFSFLCDGTHLASLPFTVKVSDGVSSVSTEFRIIVKEKTNTPPSFINLPGTLSVFQGSTLTHQFEASDKENNPLVFSLLDPVPGATMSSSGLLTFKSSVVGTVNLTIFVSDGYVSVNQVIAIKVDLLTTNTAPTFINPPTDLLAYTNKVFTYQFTANDKENDKLTFSFPFVLQGVDITSSGLLTVSLKTTATLKLQVMVSDGIVSTSQDVIVEVKDIPNTPPVFVDPGVLYAVVGQTFKYQFVVNDKENDRIIFLLSYPVPEATITSDGLLTFKSNVVGPVQFEVIANDGLALTNFTVTIKTENANNTAPAFVNPPGTLKAYVDETIYYQFSASDAENDKLKFVFLNSLDETSITNDGLLSFKASKVGTYKFTVLVSDGKLTASTEVTVVVDFNVGTEDIPEVNYSVKAYPNPVVSNLSIEFTLDKSSLVSVTLYDLQGRLVTLINKDKYEAGENTIDFDASNLRSGAYLCKFVAGNFNQTIKIIKQ